MKIRADFVTNSSSSFVTITFTDSKGKKIKAEFEDGMCPLLSNVYSACSYDNTEDYLDMVVEDECCVDDSIIENLRTIKLDKISCVDISYQSESNEDVTRIYGFAENYDKELGECVNNVSIHLDLKNKECAYKCNGETIAINKDNEDKMFEYMDLREMKYSQADEFGSKEAKKLKNLDNKIKTDK